MRISYSGGATVYNIRALYDAGIWPVTLATDVLKPGGYEHVGKALVLELVNGIHASVELHLGAKGQAELGIVGDIVARDTELGDHVTDQDRKSVV